MAAPLSAVVLAGGQGRRLGVPKDTLTFAGRPLLDIVVQRVSCLCDEVVVACGSDDRQVPLPGARCVPDLMPGQGPLAGLHAGLRSISSPYALVVACDMPFLEPRLLAHMARLPRDYQALVPYTGGAAHPLHAIYAKECLPVVGALLAQGANSMHELLSRLRVRVVPDDDIRRFDPEALSLFNLNTPSDLDRARALWNERRHGVAVA